MDKASQAQIAATNPRENIWVEANAGSGKTRVLTSRVVRLLLAGHSPDRILCLTYTKAAASEMLQRLFGTLGDWAMLNDSDLRSALIEIGESEATLDTVQLRKARQLFAQALDTPGGLKIQTIHSFCEAILRRFPLEAGMSPAFQVLDERAEQDFIKQALGRFAADEPDLFDIFAKRFSTQTLSELVPILRDAYKKGITKPIPQNYGHDPSIDLVDLKKQILFGSEELLSHLSKALMKSSKNDQRFAGKIANALNTPDSILALKSFESALLTGAKAAEPFAPKGAASITKGAKDVLGYSQAEFDDIKDSLQSLAEDVAAARKARLAKNEYETAKVIYEFIAPFDTYYDEMKRFAGHVTYDDLIDRVIQLLTQTSMAQWILYRLDGGIDHILVDEAQDTSPKQWKIIEAIIESFADNRSDTHPKTLFVVGDAKQSIYSFQGADPDVFVSKRDELNSRFEPVNAPVLKRELAYSFRSSKVILELVDRVFDGTLPVAFPIAKHLAFKSEKPGRVSFWPFLDNASTKTDTPWYEPLNTPSPNDPRLKLARLIADDIKERLERGSAQPKDILILVQRRGVIFRAIIDALKSHNLPIAGADKLDLTEVLAVKDLLSLLKFLNMPDDDLALAEALRSPLFQLSENELFHLAHGRSGRLWQSLRNSDAHQDIVERLKMLRAKVDFIRPYELLEDILTIQNGRESLVARLGEESQDGIDELLTQALNFETTQAPTLAGFLNWIFAAPIQVKRELSSDVNQIRVMSVHGAKGLEAPVVYLADTGKMRPPPNKIPIYQSNGLCFAGSPENEQSDQYKQQVDIHKEGEAREKLRLLYVAMTRAESELIICGAGEKSKENIDWYDLISDSFGEAELQVHPELGQIKCIQYGELKPLVDAEHSTQNPGNESYRPYQAAPTAKRPVKITPSNLPGRKSLAAEGDAPVNAALFGTALHSLLEHLPNTEAEKIETLAARILAKFDIDKTQGDRLLAKAKSLISNPALQHIFSSESLREVSFSAKHHERILGGTIDRLIIDADRITIVDFKSNRMVPENSQNIPSGILAQMGAYGVAMAQIYPDHDINLQILWTETEEIMSVAHDLAIEAFNSAL